MLPMISGSQNFVLMSGTKPVRHGRHTGFLSGCHFFSTTVPAMDKGIIKEYGDPHVLTWKQLNPIEPHWTQLSPIELD